MRRVIVELVMVNVCTNSLFVSYPQTWSRTATQLLYQMTKDKAIVAIISSMQVQYLCACTDKIHVHVCAIGGDMLMYLTTVIIGSSM